VILVESDARLDSRLVTPSVKPCAVFGRILTSGCGAGRTTVRAEAVDSALLQQQLTDHSDWGWWCAEGPTARLQLLFRGRLTGSCCTMCVSIGEGWHVVCSYLPLDSVWSGTITRRRLVWRCAGAGETDMRTPLTHMPTQELAPDIPETFFAPWRHYCQLAVTTVRVKGWSRENVGSCSWQPVVGRHTRTLSRNLLAAALRCYQHHRHACAFRLAHP
jgi:hypothetical protein